MPLWKQRLLARYMAPQGDDGGGGGGGSGGGSDEQLTDDEKTALEAAKDKGDDDLTDEEKALKVKAEKIAAADKKGGKGGKQTTDEEARLLKENMKKKAELQKKEEELKAARARLAEFDGLDAKELKKLVEEKKAAEEAALAAKGDFETLKKRMAEEHGKVISAKDTELAAVKETNVKLAKTIEELTVGQAFANSHYITEETVYTPGKARKVYGDHMDVVDGEVVVFDKPRGASNRTPLVDQYGNNLAFETAIAKLIEADPDKEHILKAKVRNGAGSGSDGKPAKKGGDQPTTGMEKIQAGLGALFKG